MIRGGLAELRRWIDSGGGWELVSSDDHHVVVALLTCTGGEVVDTLDSTDPALRAHVLGPSPD